MSIKFKNERVGKAFNLVAKQAGRSPESMAQELERDARGEGGYRPDEEEAASMLVMVDQIRGGTVGMDQMHWILEYFSLADQVSDQVFELLGITSEEEGGRDDDEPL